MFLTDILTGITSNYIYNKLANENKNEPKSVNLEINVFTDSKVETKNKYLYNKQLSDRLLLSIDLMSSKHEKLSASSICDYLSFSSVNMIEDYLCGNQEPTSDFLRRYSDYFGIEFKWLRHGEGNKFIKAKSNPKMPSDYKIQIDDINPNHIFLIRSKSKNGEAGIILQLTEFKYLILPKVYNISGEVGGIGQLQLLSFYDLIENLSCAYPISKLSGLQLNKNEFDELFAGEIYPSKYLCGQKSFWWDDLLDFEHKYPISKNYEALYGKGFIEAQSIIDLIKKKA